MDLIDKEHIPRRKVRQRRNKIAFLLNDRTRGRANFSGHFGSNNICQCSFSKPRWSEDQRMIKGLSPGSSRIHKEPHLLNDGWLANILRQCLWPNRPVLPLVLNSRLWSN